MQEIKNQNYTGERALFKSQHLKITDTNFFDGESPLKESSDLQLINTTFDWKYPLWYCQNITAEQMIFQQNARSGIWYTENITIADSLFIAPKTFRRAMQITLTDCVFFNAEETMWTCKDITLQRTTINGDYFGKDSENIYMKDSELNGNYAFDGAKNIEIHNSRLISKDAFWNAENVYVKDSTLIGEYLGWNAKNLTLENCTIQSEQGLCYVENLIIRNSRILNTTLAFEYATVAIETTSVIDSIKNVTSGSITAKGIKEIIFDDKKIEPNKTTIIVK